MLLTELCVKPAAVSLNGTTGCTSSPRLSHKISHKPNVSSVSPDNDEQAPGGGTLAETAQQAAFRASEVGHVELVQLLSVRSSRLRRVVRTGRDLPEVLALRPALARLGRGPERPRAGAAPPRQRACTQGRIVLRTLPPAQPRALPISGVAAS